jgi:hypothetical protein
VIINDDIKYIAIIQSGIVVMISPAFDESCFILFKYSHILSHILSLCFSVIVTWMNKDYSDA